MGEQSVFCILKALSSGGMVTTSLTRKGSRVTCLNSPYSPAAFPTRGGHSTQVAEMEKLASQEVKPLCAWEGFPLTSKCLWGREGGGAF